MKNFQTTFAAALLCSQGFAGSLTQEESTAQGGDAFAVEVGK